MSDIYNQLCAETGSAGIFPGFKIYERYPRTETLFFPCIVMAKEELGNSMTFFGNQGTMELLEVSLDLAFKEKDGYIRLGHDSYQYDQILSLYTDRLRNFYNAMTLSSEIKIDDVTCRMTYHYPEDTNQELIGLSFVIGIHYVRE